jgi:hypothetical protein
LLKRADTQIESLASAPTKAAGKIASDLERTVKQLYDILQKAWAYCGANPSNDEAFARYKGVLDGYVRGNAALDEYRSGRSSYGNEP